MNPLPLFALDTETTGTEPGARIVEVAVVPIDPPGPPRVRRLNPGIPIPAEATAVHGITDADVADCPRFAQVARGLADLLTGVDVVGFNVTFDLVLLSEEFTRAGVDWTFNGRILDAMAVFKHYHPRDLSAAVRTYLGREHEGAHGAGSDAGAAAEVLRAQIAAHGIDLDEVARLSGADKRVDLAGRLMRLPDGRVAYAIGKAKGTAVLDDPGFGRWMLKQDFPEDTKARIRAILGGCA